jgi:hypothetical protein
MGYKTHKDRRFGAKVTIEEVPPDVDRLDPAQVKLLLIRYINKRIKSKTNRRRAVEHSNETRAMNSARKKESVLRIAASIPGKHSNHALAKRVQAKLPLADKLAIRTIRRMLEK